MGVAEELADLWRDVPDKPTPGAENEYFATLLRLTLESKKRVEQTGRRYATLPTLRDLIRKRIVRVPAEHVKWLEVSGFDLVANPLKKSLQGFVSQFTAEDIPLVDWFVRAAKNDSSLALDVRALEAWLAGQKPAGGPNTPASMQPSSTDSKGAADSSRETAELSKPEIQEPVSGKDLSNSQDADLPPDRIFEST